MLFRLTFLLIAGIFIAMYFAPESPAPEERASVEPPNGTARALPPSQPVPAPVETAPEPAETTEPALETVASGEEAATSDANLSSQIEQSITDLLTEALPDEDAPEESVPELPGFGLGALSQDSVGNALSLSESVRNRAGSAAGGSEALAARPQLPATAPPDPAAGQTAPVARAMVIGTAVNLRAGPSTANSVVGRVDFGDEVDLLAEESDGWSEIRNPVTGASAFMASRFLQQLPE